MEWTSQTGTWTKFEIFPPTLGGRFDCFRQYGWKKPIQRSPALMALARRSRAWLQNRERKEQ
jgi:hypothetical protein